MVAHLLLFQVTIMLHLSSVDLLPHNNNNKLRQSIFCTFTYVWSDDSTLLKDLKDHQKGILITGNPLAYHGVWLVMHYINLSKSKWYFCMLQSIIKNAGNSKFSRIFESSSLSLSFVVSVCLLGFGLLFVWFFLCLFG